MEEGMSNWFTIPPETAEQQWFLGKGGTPERPTHVHPIGFDGQHDAMRAAARLNDRDAGILGEPAPKPDENEARAARQARIAELRGRRQPVSEVEHDHRMGVTCPACGHITPRRAMLA